MTPEQALQILNSVRVRALLCEQDHIAGQQAVDVIRAAIQDKNVDDGKKTDGKK